jgi:hypothetical protein
MCCSLRPLPGASQEGIDPPFFIREATSPLGKGFRVLQQRKDKKGWVFISTGEILIHN